MVAMNGRAQLRQTAEGLRRDYADVLRPHTPNRLTADARARLEAARRRVTGESEPEPQLTLDLRQP